MKYIIMMIMLGGILAFVGFVAAHSVFVDRESCLRSNALRQIQRDSATASIIDYNEKIPVEIGAEKKADQIRRTKLYATKKAEHMLDCSIPVPDTH